MQTRCLVLGGAWPVRGWPRGAPPSPGAWCREVCWHQQAEGAPTGCPLLLVSEFTMSPAHASDAQLACSLWEQTLRPQEGTAVR